MLPVVSSVRVYWLPRVKAAQKEFKFSYTAVGCMQLEFHAVCSAVVAQALCVCVCV